jgi:hypothetical protein
LDRRKRACKGEGEIKTREICAIAARTHLLVLLQKLYLIHVALFLFFDLVRKINQPTHGVLRAALATKLQLPKLLDLVTDFARGVR